MTPGVDGQSQVGKSGAQIGPPDQVVAWADVRSLTANSLSNYAASCERNVSDLTAKVTDFVEQMDGISRKAVRPTGSWCVASQGAGLRFRQPTCWSARRILKTGPTRGPSHVSDTRYNPQNVSRDQLKSVGAPADRTALSALRRLKGFDQILKLMSGMLRERQHRLLYLASAARVGPRSSPTSTRCWTNAWMCWTRRRNPNST